MLTTFKQRKNRILLPAKIGYGLYCLAYRRLGLPRAPACDVQLDSRRHSIACDCIVGLVGRSVYRWGLHGDNQEDLDTGMSHRMSQKTSPCTANCLKTSTDILLLKVEGSMFTAMFSERWDGCHKLDKAIFFGIKILVMLPRFCNTSEARGLNKPSIVNCRYCCQRLTQTLQMTSILCYAIWVCVLRLNRSTLGVKVVQMYTQLMKMAMKCL